MSPAVEVWTQPLTPRKVQSCFFFFNKDTMLVTECVSYWGCPRSYSDVWIIRVSMSSDGLIIGFSVRSTVMGGLLACLSRVTSGSITRVSEWRR